MKKSVVIVGIIDFLIIFGLIILYSPLFGVRALLVTTAMSTKSHHYLARTFYSENMITNVMSQNYIEDIKENTNLDDIQINPSTELTYYESDYEKEILQHNESDVYKIIELNGTGYKGFMAVIYDPSKIELVTSKNFGQKGQFLQEIAKENEALVAINAGGFADAGGTGNGGVPTGVVIQDGKIIYSGVETGWPGGIVGFTDDNKLMLTKSSPEEAIEQGLQDGIEFGPFLIVNGTKAVTKGNGGSGISPRTALAQRQDGIVLFVVIDGRQPGYSIGISLAELTELLLKYKAYNAVNLDGGASSSVVVNGEIYNNPCAVSITGERWIPNAWIVKK